MASSLQQSSRTGNGREDCGVVALGADKARVGSGGVVDGIIVSVKSPMVVVVYGGGGVYGVYVVLRRKRRKEKRRDNCC